METPEELAEQLTRAYQPTGQDDLAHLVTMTDFYLSTLLHHDPDFITDEVKEEMAKLIVALREVQ